jgi:hypothetical protein
MRKRCFLKKISVLQAVFGHMSHLRSFGKVSEITLYAHDNYYN